MGKTQTEVAEYLMEQYDLCQRYAVALVKAAMHDVEENYVRYSANIAQYNIKRLNQIIDECFKEKKYQDALKAIDMLNKMGCLYTQNVHIEQDPIITLNFNG